MAFRNIPPFHELDRVVGVTPGDEPALPIELSSELEGLRKLSLTLLMAFLTVHEISASNALAAATLALLVYTINLHIAINTRFLRSSPALSRLLHFVPLFGIFCMAVFKLVIFVRPPAVLAAVLLACASPPLIIAIHPLKRYAQTMWVWNVAPVLPGPSAADAAS